MRDDVANIFVAFVASVAVVALPLKSPTKIAHFKRFVLGLYVTPFTISVNTVTAPVVSLKNGIGKSVSNIDVLGKT